MAASGALGVIGVNRAAGDRPDRVLDEAGFVQRIGMDGDLDIEFFRYIEAGRNRRRRRAPVLVQLQPDRSGFHLLAESIRQ